MYKTKLIILFLYTTFSTKFIELQHVFLAFGNIVYKQTDLQTTPEICAKIHTYCCMQSGGAEGCRVISV